MNASKRRRASRPRRDVSLQQLARTAWVVGLAAGATGLAQALDLGEARGSLVLGQALRVDVPLLLSPEESTDGLKVSVRGRAALSGEADTAWMPGPFRILFTSLDGRPGLRICHEQPLQEPILELHVALRGADGNIIRRRYDLLTDPPGSSSAVSACEPASAVIANPRKKRVDLREHDATAPASPRPATARGSQLSGTIVRPGDTLSEVAQALRGDRPIPLPVMVDALYRANPEAFDGSADRLRAGRRLAVPDMRTLGADEPAAAAAPPSPAVEERMAPAGGMPRLHWSERLSSIPSAAEQQRVAERYRGARTVPAAASTVRPPALGIEAPVAAEPTAEARIWPPPAETAERASASTLGGMPDWVRDTLVAALVAVLLLLVLARGRRRPPRPSVPAKPAPAPVTLPATASAAPPAPPPLAETLPVHSRTQDMAQEVGRDFYDEVATLLIATLQQNPERRDLRFRLLDLYFTSGKRDAFVEHSRRYLEFLGGMPDENWPEIVRMGRQIAPETGLYSAQPADVARATVIPLQGARSGTRRFYENADPSPLRALREHLDRAYAELRRDVEFWREFAALSRDWLPPDPGLKSAERLTNYLGGGRILFRDERLRDIDEAAALVAIGQVLIARRLGYRRVVSGGMHARHALIVAQAAQRLGLRCTMHLTDGERIHHAGGLERVIGAYATIEPVPDASFGLAANAQLCALNDALGSHDSLYVSPAAAGPPPYPTIVVDLVAMQGRILRAKTTQLLGRAADVLITHSGDGLHTLGAIEAFLDAGDTRLLCMESGVPAGPPDLLFPREHRLLRATGRVDYQRIPEEAARFTTQFCAEREYARLGTAGSEVFAAALRAARDLSSSQSVVAVLPSEMAAVAAGASAEAVVRHVDAARVIPLPPRP